MNSGVYKITNLITNKSYIGVSKHIEQRWKEHKTGRGSKKLYEDFLLYGLKNFSFEILELCDENIMYEKEPIWIEYYNSYYDGYNENPGGGYGNIAAINKTKKTIYCYDLEGNFIKKYDSLSDAERETNISNSNISRAAKNQGRTEQYQWSYEYIENFPPYKRKCYIGQKYNGENLKRVNQYDKNGKYIATYFSITEAAKQTGANATCIGEICKEKGKGKRKTSGGFIWRYEGDTL